MKPFAIVEAFDVPDDRDPRSVACREGFAMHELVLQRGKEALRAGVVVAIAIAIGEPGSECTFVR